MLVVADTEQQRSLLYTGEPCMLLGRVFPELFPAPPTYTLPQPTCTEGWSAFTLGTQLLLRVGLSC